MEKCRNLTTCSLELLDDPVLKTTAANYDFKYVPGEQFQRVIRTVQRDRLKHKKDSIWSEFCSTKMRPSISNPKEKESPSKYEVKTTPKPRHVVKTKASTIKIISQPIVENTSDPTKSARSQESYKIYKVPKVRIMTDEEIKNVVENAFKEVMEQSENSQIVSQLLTDPEERKGILSAERVLEESKPDLDGNESKPQLTTRSMKSIESARTIKSMSEEQTVPEDIPLKTGRNVESEQVLEFSDESPKVSARSQLSIRSNTSAKSREDVVSLKSVRQVSEDEIEYKVEKIEKTQVLAITPELTTHEREEFRKFLKIEEFIVHSEIDLDRFEDKPSSSSDEEDDNESISPLIHITQPTPTSRVQTKAQNFLGPIKSSASSLENNHEEATHHENTSSKNTENINKKPMPAKNVSPCQIEKSPTKSPRKSPIISPCKSLPKSPCQSPCKSPVKKSAKPSPLSSSRVSLLSAKKTKTPRSASKVKKLKSPRPTEKQQNEVKQEHEMLITKIAAFLMKIIQAIEKIGVTLEDIPEPDGPLDLKRREKRADEFIGRFARNYLYQIGRSIEDIRIIPKESYMAGDDNELPTKACNLYNTLSQAVHSYLKHMSSFIVDRNPKKLGTLVDAISEGTKMCVHKKLFEKSDATVQDLLRKTKNLKAYLVEAQQHIEENPLPKLKQKAKTVKIVKGGSKSAKQPKKLSMYDSIPASTSVVKSAKSHPLKGTARSKTSVQSLISKPSNESGVNKKKEPNKPTGKNVDEKMQSKEEMSQSAKSKPQISQSTYKDDVFPIKTPRMDQVSTLIETIRNDDQDEPMNVTNENLLKGILSNIHIGENQDPAHSSHRQKDINDTMMRALESITKQQLQQLLGPIVTNIEGPTSAKADGGTGVDVNTILNLIASHFGGGGVGGAGPSAGNEETYQQNQQGSHFSNGIQFNADSLSDAGHAYDINANYERELAVQNQPRLDEPHSRPAPNTFPVGELNNLVTSPSSQQPTSTTTMTQDPAAGKEIEDNRALDSGSRTRATNGSGDYTGACNNGGDFGATQSEIETRKVQRVRCDRNVQFTFVTDNEEDPGSDGSIGSANNSLHAHKIHVTPIKKKLKKDQPSDEEFDKVRIIKLIEDRSHYLQQLTGSPLYVNKSFGQPWKIVSKIANQIVDDAINDVERSISFGEESFVRDFIQMELQS